MNKPYQRIGSISTAQVSSDFEHVALKFFSAMGIYLVRSFPVEIGLSGKKKVHKA